MKVLRGMYHILMDKGELDGRGFVAYSLKQSLDYADDSVARGLPIEDWNSLLVASNSWMRSGDVMMQRMLGLLKCKGVDRDYYLITLQVQQILAFTR